MAASNTHDCPCDCVQYLLFPLKSNEYNSQTELSSIIEKYTTFLSKQLVEYIWQCEPFSLNIGSDTGDALPCHLKGLTKFGDNVEDEWFIVYLLLELTRAFPDLVVKVWDSDGDFLLIEAAEVLPKWLDPDTSENRIYLYRGAVHIIPVTEPEKKNPETVEPPSLSDAISKIRNNPLVTKARDQIQNFIKKRISIYPHSITTSHHRTHCKVPAAIAVLLKEQPSLLSAAINAFYYRDPIDSKACRAMKYFPPEACAMTEVTFTRCLYAQLMQQKYKPDCRTGWKIPPPNHPDFKSHDLGMKLACGFEILVCNASADTNENYVPSFQDLENSIKWQKFVHSLKDKNYFQNQMEGSKLYISLLNQARDYYISSMQNSSDSSSGHIGSKIKNMLKSLEVDMNKLKEEENSLHSPDDDNWLALTPEQLDDILSSKGKVDYDEKDFANVIPEKLSKFVEHISSFKGAEFPSEKAGDGPIKLDPELFTDACKNILDLNVPEWKNDSASSSGMSDYDDDELDSDDDELPSSRTKKAKSRNGTNFNANKLSGEMKDYMDQMDRELSCTAVGKSFERLPENKKNPGHLASYGSSEDDEDLPPINVDLTALKNILESYNSQEGMPGPASTLLSQMGVKLPENSDLS
ncbi:Protein ecdysoneless [Nymphon striatum]|nr:Protein ecdysoneless [Nymphon striatum]